MQQDGLLEVAQIVALLLEHQETHPQAIVPVVTCLLTKPASVARCVLTSVKALPAPSSTLFDDAADVQTKQLLRSLREHIAADDARTLAAATTLLPATPNPLPATATPGSGGAAPPAALPLLSCMMEVDVDTSSDGSHVAGSAALMTQAVVKPTFTITAPPLAPLAVTSVAHPPAAIRPARKPVLDARQGIPRVETHATSIEAVAMASVPRPIAASVAISASPVTPAKPPATAASLASKPPFTPALPAPATAVAATPTVPSIFD